MHRLWFIIHVTQLTHQYSWLLFILSYIFISTHSVSHWTYLVWMSNRKWIVYDFLFMLLMLLINIHDFYSFWVIIHSFLLIVWAIELTCFESPTENGLFLTYYSCYSPYSSIFMTFIHSELSYINFYLWYEPLNLLVLKIWEKLNCFWNISSISIILFIFTHLFHSYFLLYNAKIHHI